MKDGCISFFTKSFSKQSLIEKYTEIFGMLMENGNIDIDIEHNNCKSQILQPYFKSSKNSLTSLLILLPLSKSFVLPFVHTFYPIKMHVEKFQTYI